MTSANAPVEILIVDAGTELLAALERALVGEDAQTRRVVSADGAQAAIAARLPDLILLDVGDTPSPRSFELCARLHSADAGTPILLAGRFTTAAEIERGRDSGAIDFVNPPFEPALLRARLQVHLAAVRTRLALRREQHARLSAEDDSRAAHRAKSELLASMGHEIRTPMTAILGMSHLALQSGLNPKQRNYVEKVERSAELLLGTLNDILDFSRIDAGTLSLQRAPFELAELLDSVGRLVALKAEDKGLELLFDLPRQLPTRLVGDLARLAQVLVNLGLDAVRAGQHGEVVIGVEAVERSATRAVLRFSVRDTGSAADRPAQGADLGATLGRQLLRLMGSELLVTPLAGPGYGVHFAVAFELPPSADESPPPLPAPGGARVLVVDDNASARRILLGMSAELGLQAEAARDGWDALRMATQAQRAGRPYDLVLLDWKMPGMDGIECAHHLNAGQPEPPAILMLTAFGQHDVTQRLSAQRIAVRGVLAKPVTPAALSAACRAALHHESARERGVDRERTMGQHAAQLRGARILLVEDNAIIQELALELLSSAGIVVSVAGNGREALDRLARQSFDGVLMDCQMPVLDGYDTTRAMRAQPQWRALPVIALTANTLEGERERVLAAGMNDHIAKPLDVPLMFETLARWVHPVRAPEPLPAPAPAADPDDPLTRLPGIDVRIGRTSTMNNDKLYRRLLGMFRDGQRDVIAQFRAARTAGDDATAMRLAHNLRAVSASLGATAVQQSSGALERACAERAPEARIEALLGQVEVDLTPVMAGLMTSLPPP